MLCEVMGRSPIAPRVFNCNAPDTGNMEILVEFGTPEQKKRWLAPLLAGETRSCFSMTEPETAGSDPTLLRTRAVRDGDQYVINGHKWFTSGAYGAAFAIVMTVTEGVIPGFGYIFKSLPSGTTRSISGMSPSIGEHSRSSAGSE